MYYPQARPQSPARQILQHEPAPSWAQPPGRYPLLPQPQPPLNGAQGQGAPPAQSYGLVQYTNGGAHPHAQSLIPHHHPQQQHFMHTQYQSPSHLHQSHRQTTASPPPQPAAPIPKHWQTQLDHADVSHFHAHTHTRLANPSP